MYNIVEIRKLSIRVYMSSYQLLDKKNCVDCCHSVTLPPSYKLLPVKSVFNRILPIPAGTLEMSRWHLFLVVGCLVSIAIVLTISVLGLIPSFNSLNYTLAGNDFREHVWSFSMDFLLSLFLCWCCKRSLSFYWLRKYCIGLFVAVISLTLLLLRCLAANVMTMVYFFVGFVSSQVIILLSSVIFTSISNDLHIGIVSYLPEVFRPVLAAVYFICLVLTVFFAVSVLNSELLLFFHLAAILLPLVLLSMVPDILPVNWLTLSLDSLFALLFLRSRTSSLFFVAMACGSFVFLTHSLFFRSTALRSAIRSILVEVGGGRGHYSEIPSEDRPCEDNAGDGNREELVAAENSGTDIAEEMKWQVIVVFGVVVVAVLFLLCQFSESLWRGLGVVNWLLHWTVFYCSWLIRMRQFGRYQAMKQALVTLTIEEAAARSQDLV